MQQRCYHAGPKRRSAHALIVPPVLFAALRIKAALAVQRHRRDALAIQSNPFAPSISRSSFAATSPIRDGPSAEAVRNSLDLYLPKGAKDFPVLVFVHGGAWVIGDNRCCGLYPSVAEPPHAKRGIAYR